MYDCANIDDVIFCSPHAKRLSREGSIRVEVFVFFEVIFFFFHFLLCGMKQTRKLRSIIVSGHTLVSIAIDRFRKHNLAE